MVKMVNIMFCVFYHPKKSLNKKLVRKFKQEDLESLFSLMKMTLVPVAKCILLLFLRAALSAYSQYIGIIHDNMYTKY